MKFVKNVALLLLVFVLFSCSKEETSSTPEPPQIPKYTVSITAGDGGIVSSAGGTYDKDTQISVTATPNAEYIFQSWGDGSTDNPRSIKVTEDLTITANFIKKQYDLIVNVVGEGAVTEEVVVQGGRYNSGSQIKLTAAESEGWKFEGWSGALETTDNPITLSVDGEKEITATFIREKYDLNITIEGEGTVTEEVVVQPGQYDYETQVKLTATPSVGWEFSAWSGDMESTDNPLVISIEGFQNINAVFVNIDSDGDGINDDIDECPDTPSGEEVDESGCSDSQKVYLDENGVTIKCRNCKTGEVYDFNGVRYIVLSDSSIKNYISNNSQLLQIITSNITNMGGLFSDERGSKINQLDLSTWDVSNVTYMQGLFSFGRLALYSEGVTVNQDLSNWDVSNVTYMGEMFKKATFNGDISKWDVSQVRDMSSMFSLSSFNQDISNWDVSNVASMNLMFFQTPFNQDISNWDVSKVVKMARMFESSSFNQDISKWDVSRVADMEGMFSQTPFNQDISKWDVSQVRDMSSMFSLSSFNQDISNWDVSKVGYMDHMFSGCASFNQDLSGWDSTRVVRCNNFSRNTPNWVKPKPVFIYCNPD